eukprot:m.611713 g.611713  ORF g.611713 m.611713 type:complete len:60 (+) comp22500_c0_seq35:3266-3445(+)
MPAEQDPCAAVVHVANSLDVWLALVRDVFCMHLRVTEAPAADATDPSSHKHWCSWSTLR